MPKIIEEKCLGCGACLPVCPVHAISIEKDKAVINMDLCTKCGACIPACPVGIIEPGKK